MENRKGIRQSQHSRRSTIRCLNDLKVPKDAPRSQLFPEINFNDLPEFFQAYHHQHAELVHWQLISRQIKPIKLSNSTASFKNDLDCKFSAYLFVFSYHYLVLCFNSVNVDANLFLESIYELLQQPEFEFIQNSVSQLSGKPQSSFQGLPDNISQIALKNILSQYLNLLQYLKYSNTHGQMNIMETIFDYPAMADILVTFFATITYLGKVDPQTHEQRFGVREIYDFLATYFDIELEMTENNGIVCGFFSLTDVFFFQVDGTLYLTHPSCRLRSHDISNLLLSQHTKKSFKNKLQTSATNKSDDQVNLVVSNFDISSVTQNKISSQEGLSQASIRFSSPQKSSISLPGQDHRNPQGVEIAEQKEKEDSFYLKLKNLEQQYGDFDTQIKSYRNITKLIGNVNEISKQLNSRSRNVEKLEPFHKEKQTKKPKYPTFRFHRPSHLSTTTVAQCKFTKKWVTKDITQQFTNSFLSQYMSQPFQDNVQERKRKGRAIRKSAIRTLK